MLASHYGQESLQGTDNKVLVIHNSLVLIYINDEYMVLVRISSNIDCEGFMLQGDDRIILGNVAKVIFVLIVVMCILIAAANYLS